MSEAKGEEMASSSMFEVKNFEPAIGWLMLQHRPDDRKNPKAADFIASHLIRILLTYHLILSNHISVQSYLRSPMDVSMNVLEPIL